MRRASERFLAFVVLLVVSPLLLLLMALVRVRLGRPVMFHQERAGMDGEPFQIVKLRTMTDACGPTGALLSDDCRTTSFGGWLRSTSLDELPELWNIVRGDMVLVGPRPLPVAYVPRYTAEEARRHEVRPGITGWAQVNGRNSIDWDDRLAMDVWYIDHRTLGLDLRILRRTAMIVLRRSGISGSGTVTMHELRPHLQEPTANCEQ